MSALDRQRRSRAKRKAAGICRNCAQPVCSRSKNYCEAHHEENVARLRRLSGRAERVPTFEDFCRLEDER